MADPLVPCHRCEGSGLVPMEPALKKTLELLTATPQSTEELRAALAQEAPSPTAICNRLAALEELGYARRAGKRGRAALWVSHG